jgi:predicted DNA-binding transcriptional regulator YafY
MRNGQLVRVLALMQRLRSGRHTLASLACEFRVHQRTIRRDLEALSVAGVPVRHSADVAGDDAPLRGFWWMQR